MVKLVKALLLCNEIIEVMEFPVIWYDIEYPPTHVTICKLACSEVRHVRVVISEVQQHVFVRIKQAWTNWCVDAVAAKHCRRTVASSIARFCKPFASGIWSVIKLRQSIVSHQADIWTITDKSSGIHIQPVWLEMCKISIDRIICKISVGAHLSYYRAPLLHVTLFEEEA